MAEASEKFIAQSMRHLAELRRVKSEGDDRKPPYPKGWFDLPPEMLADLGAMFFLSSLIEYHRPRSLASVAATLEPPLRLGQYRMFRSGGHPRAFLTWAGLDAQAERQFAVERRPIKPEQWNCGDSVWIVDLVAPFGHIDEIVAMLGKSYGTNRLRTLWHNRAGTRARVIEWTRSPDGEVSVTSYGQNQFTALLDGG